MTTRIDVLRKMQADLAWRGPGGKQLGNIVLPRRDAETLLKDTEADAILVVSLLLSARLKELMEKQEKQTDGPDKQTDKPEKRPA